VSGGLSPVRFAFVVPTEEDGRAEFGAIHKIITQQIKA
jgi:hypothetical protein